MVWDDDEIYSDIVALWDCVSASRDCVSIDLGMRWDLGPKW